MGTTFQNLSQLSSTPLQFEPLDKPAVGGSSPLEQRQPESVKVPITSGGSLTQGAVVTAYRQTVLTKDNKGFLEVTVPSQFQKVRPFSFVELEKLEATVRGNGYATQLGNSEDRGRFLLLERLAANATFPKEGLDNRSPVLADHASRLAGGLAYQHAGLETLSGYQRMDTQKIVHAFGSPEKLTQLMVECRTVIRGLQKEADALLAKNSRLIQSPALTEAQFNQRFNPHPR